MLKNLAYHIEQNFGGKKIWRNYDFEILAEKTLVNPRLACIFVLHREFWRKNLANCGDLPNSPKFSPRQSFVLYGIYLQILSGDYMSHEIYLQL